MGIKIIMLPNSVPAMIVLCDKSIPFSTSSVGSLYKYDPYNKNINKIIRGTTKNEMHRNNFYKIMSKRYH